MNAIRNFVQLTDHVGTAGQPMVDQFDLIAEGDYRHVVNLAMPDHEDSIDNEGQIVTSLGMNYFHIPVPFDAPQPHHVKQFCSFMGLFEGDRIFVHCIMNYRVSAFMYHYLSKVAGVSEEQARSPMFSRWNPDEIWATMLNWSAEDIGL